MALSTPILRDIVGLQNLSRALGLLLMCVGLDHLFTIVVAGKFTTWLDTIVQENITNNTETFFVSLPHLT